ncbi:glycosyltransferase family 4 protein [Nitrincola sp. A-D6]|uniref:glycosyltransferase family 4 protein n=1 Tax=Nitrincola sp. A-D6 TaxID=1545442 RepID=UPI001F1D589A|nr:glycosyltransferase family 4 protein [Nitrincola sp. A-D6]
MWLHSLFYVGYLNFLLLLGLLIAVSTWLYGLIFVERDYYPSFDRDPALYLQQPLRVAMFTNNYLPFIGGVPISIDRLRRGLDGLGHKVLTVAPAYNKQDDDAAVVRVPILLPLGRNREFRLANLFQPAIYQRVRAFKPDIIHVHHPFWLGSAGLWMGRRLGIPVVLTYHTRLEHYAHYVPLPGPLFRNLVSHALVKRFANRCDAVVVPTESAEEYLRMIGVRCPIHIQPTGIEYARFKEVSEDDVAQLRRELAPEGERLLLSISRLGREKNLDFLLDALHQLRKTCKQPLRLVILGEGRERAHLEARINAEGLEGIVLLPGSVPPEQIPIYCRAADVFVFASCSETQGMVILEAMAAGLPVVTVRSSGIDDIVEQGHNGFKTALDKEQWSRQVCVLLEDEPLRSQMAQAAVSFAAQYDIAPFSQSIAELYAYALAQKQADSPRQADGA